METLRPLLLRASESDWLEDRVRSSAVAQRAVRRFLPGEELEDALRAARELDDEGIDPVLTCLGEHMESASGVGSVVDHYSEVLDRGARTDLEVEISVKPTHLGLDVDPDLTLEGMKTLAAQAQRLDSFLWIDMEESEYVDPTLDLYRELLREYPCTGVCLQAYLYRTASDLRELLNRDASIRLVKGGYREPPDVAIPDDQEIDEHFLELARLMLRANDDASRPAFATHDDTLIRQVQRAADQEEVGANEYEFQMLYGIRPTLQRRLSDSGYRSRVLISYGEEWFPWYMRRLAERPANLLLLAKNLAPGS